MANSILNTIIRLISAFILGNNRLFPKFKRDQNQIAVYLVLTWENALSSMQILLDLDMSDLGLRVDSVSFVGSRCESFLEQFYRVYENQDKVFIYLIESANPELDSSPLLPGTGPIATIYLTRVGQPLTPRHVIRNNRIDDNEGRDLTS